MLARVCCAVHRAVRFAKPFDNTLLTQAVAVVVFQLALVQVCTDVRFTDEKKRRSADGVLVRDGRRWSPLCCHRRV